MVHQEMKLKQLFTVCMLKCIHAHTHISPSEKMYTALIIHNANYPSRIQNNVIYILKQYTNIHTVVKFCKLEKIHIRSHYRYSANRKQYTSSVVSH
jgi:hypothetical protein